MQILCASEKNRFWNGVTRREGDKLKGGKTRDVSFSFSFSWEAHQEGSPTPRKKNAEVQDMLNYETKNNESLWSRTKRRDLNVSVQK